MPKIVVENNEKLTGPGKGWVGVGSVIILTIATWVFLWTLHVKLWHDPMNPLSPNETPGVVAPHQESPNAQPGASTPARQPQ